MTETTATARPHDTGLARRSVVMTSLIAGFTLATRRVDAQAIHTDTAGIETGETQIPTTNGKLPAYYAHPSGNGPFPIILVNEEIFGVHEYIKDVCRRLAKAGYLAVATEFYARIADLSQMTDSGTIMTQVIAKAPDAQYMSDLDSTATWAKRHGGSATRMGVIGFCRGGRQTWLYAAHNPHLRAAVAFYGPLGGTPSPIQPDTALEIAGKIQCPMLGLYGGKDPSIPLDVVRQAEAKARAAHKIIDIQIYPDAGHGFHADYRPSYNQAAAEAGWKRALAWFHRYGV